MSFLNSRYFNFTILLIPLFINAEINVLTTSGSIKAITQGGVHIWKNIPYAQPPI